MNSYSWLKTNSGYAGRNGYIIKKEGQWIGFVYGEAESAFSSPFARDCKNALDLLMTPEEIVPVQE